MIMKEYPTWERYYQVAQIGSVVSDYIERFYLRPDGVDRGRDEFFARLFTGYLKVFQSLYLAGFWVRKLTAIYTSCEDYGYAGMEFPELTIILDIRGRLNNPTTPFTAANLSNWIEEDPKNWPFSGKYPEGIQFIDELRDDACHQVTSMGCSCQLLVIQETY